MVSLIHYQENEKHFNTLAHALQAAYIVSCFVSELISEVVTAILTFLSLAVQLSMLSTTRRLVVILAHT